MLGVIAIGSIVVCVSFFAVRVISERLKRVESIMGQFSGSNSVSSRASKQVD